MNILITAGPTREPIDPVRFLSNRSTGKMGYALAEAAAKKGHRVVLVSGPTTLPKPEGTELIRVETAVQMSEEVKRNFAQADLTIMCAAVADYRPVKVWENKLKKGEENLTIELERTEDILKSLGAMKRPDQMLGGFAAETQNLQSYALEKLERKNLDWIAANQVGAPDRGFAADTNAATLYFRDGSVRDLPLMTKSDLAAQILDLVLPCGKN